MGFFLVFILSVSASAQAPAPAAPVVNPFNVCAQQLGISIQAGGFYAAADRAKIEDCIVASRQKAMSECASTTGIDPSVYQGQKLPDVFKDCLETKGFMRRNHVPDQISKPSS